MDPEERNDPMDRVFPKVTIFQPLHGYLRKISNLKLNSDLLKQIKFTVPVKKTYTACQLFDFQNRQIS